MRDGKKKDLFDMKLYGEVMPRLMKKYGFKLNDPIIHIMTEVITDPTDLRDFKNAYKYPNGFPHWKNN